MYNESMETLSRLLPDNLYHSYIIEGNPDETPRMLRDFFEVRGDIEVNSQDLLYEVYDSLSIDDVIKIKEWHSTRPVAGGKKISIIGLKFMNREAEQALLKIVEEPQAGTHFFFIVPSSSVISETLLSRVHVVKVSANSIGQKGQNFLSLKPAQRIDMISEFIEDNKENNGSGFMRFGAIELINELEKILHEKLKSDKNNKDTQLSLKELALMRKFLQTPGASVKMILEHIALVI